MEKFKLLFSFLTLTFLMMTTLDSPAQTIMGDGNVVQETRSISSFDKLELNSVANIYLKQSDNESVVIEGDKNLIPYIETRVENNKLIVENKNNINIERKTKLNIYVNFKNLEQLELNSVGNIKSQNKLTLGDLTIENNSVGNISLDLDCQKLVLENNSVGNATFTGSVNECDIELNSTGNLEASDFVAQKLSIESNAMGNADVNCVKEISIVQNGMGNITYKGDAVVKKLEKSGMGNIKKL